MSGSIRDLIVSIDFSDVDVRELIRVDSAIDEIEDQLRQMGREIDDAGDEFTQMGMDAVLASAAAEAAINSLESELRSAESEADDLGDAFSVAGLKAVSMGAMWIAAASGAVAAGAPLLLAAGGLASSFAAAGGAAAAFGAVAIPTLTGLFEKQTQIESIQKKIAAADTAKERIAAQKQLASAMQGVSKEEKGALKELQGFKQFWGDFTKQFQKPIFQAFGKSLGIVKQIFQGLEPTISATAGVINELLTDLSKDISGGGMKPFFEWLATNGAEALRNFATVGGNAIQGIVNLLMAFSPVGAGIEEWLVSVSEKFAAWSASLSTSNGFQAFVEYAKTNGPVLMQTLGNVWDIIKNLITDLAPLGTTVLSALQSITSLIADNWPAIRETIIGVGAAVGSFVILMRGMQIIGIINQLMLAFRTGTILATAAQWGLNTAMLANPITWVIVGIAALIAIGVLLYRNWDKVKAAAISLWDKTKSVFAGIKDAIMSALQPVIAFFQRLIDKWNTFKSAIANFKMPSIGSMVSGAISKAKSLLPGHATGLANVPYDDYAARLHKGEAVLTAKQSDALRAAGVLGSNGKKPTVNMGAEVAPTGKTRSQSTVFAPNVKVEVNGASGDAREIGKQAAAAAKKELEKLFTQLGLAFD